MDQQCIAYSSCLDKALLFSTKQFGYFSYFLFLYKNVQYNLNGPNMDGPFTVDFELFFQSLQNSSKKTNI